MPNVAATLYPRQVQPHPETALESLIALEAQTLSALGFCQQGARYTIISTNITFSFFLLVNHCSSAHAGKPWSSLQLISQERKQQHIPQMACVASAIYRLSNIEVLYEVYHQLHSQSKRICPTFVQSPITPQHFTNFLGLPCRTGSWATRRAPSGRHRPPKHPLSPSSRSATSS